MTIEEVVGDRLDDHRDEGSYRIVTDHRRFRVDTGFGDARTVSIDERSPGILDRNT
jgi:hypothetical protein